MKSLREVAYGFRDAGLPVVPDGAKKEGEDDEKGEEVDQREMRKKG